MTTPHYFPLPPNRNRKITKNSQNFYGLKEINTLFTSTEVAQLFKQCRGSAPYLASEILHRTFKTDNEVMFAQFLEQGLNPHADITKQSVLAKGEKPVGLEDYESLVWICASMGAKRCLELLAPMVDLNEPGRSPLEAALAGTYLNYHFDCCDILLKYGASCNEFDMYQKPIVENVFMYQDNQYYFDKLVASGLTAQTLCAVNLDEDSLWAQLIRRELYFYHQAQTEVEPIEVQRGNEFLMKILNAFSSPEELKLFSKASQLPQYWGDEDKAIFEQAQNLVNTLIEKKAIEQSIGHVSSHTNNAKKLLKI